MVNQADDAAVANQQSAGSSDASAVSTDCQICALAIQRKACTISCSTCAGTVHMACLLEQYKQSDVNLATYRNSLDWLKGLLLFSGLQYSCQACRNGNPPKSTCAGNSNLQQQQMHMAEEIRVVSLSADEASTQGSVQLRKELASLHNSVSVVSGSIDQLTQQFKELKTAVQSASNVSTSLPNPCQPKLPTYAEALSANSMKAAVAQAMKEQRQADCDEASVVVYGFPEEGCDEDQLQEMLHFLNCPRNIYRHYRIGRPVDRAASASISPRPIKLEFISNVDANLLLSNAKKLRREEYYSGVNISRWLTRDKMKEIKLLRQQCNALNKSQPEGQQFVVVSGRIMRRNRSGRLEAFNANASESSRYSSQSTSVPLGAATSSSSSVPLGGAVSTSSSSASLRGAVSSSSSSSSASAPLCGAAASLASSPHYATVSLCGAPISSTACTYSKNGAVGSQEAPSMQ